MSQLDDDLRNLVDDSLTKKDAWAAIKLIGEICGAGAVMLVAANLIAALFGPGSVAAVGTGTCYYLLKRCGDIYADLPSDQRKLIRKLARGIHGLLGS